MKRLFFLFFILTVCLGALDYGLSEAAPNAKSDLKNYLNSVKKIEKTYLESFRRSLFDFSDTDLQPKARKEILERQLMPTLEKILTDMEKMETATPEVATVKQSYLVAYQTMKEGFLLRISTLEVEQVEANLLTAGNIKQAKEFREKIILLNTQADQKLNQASMESDTAMDNLLSLAQQYKVKIPPLYLLSPSRGPAELQRK